MEAAHILSSEIGIKPACESLDVSRAGFYRTQTRKATPSVEPLKRPSPPSACPVARRTAGSTRHSPHREVRG